MVSPRLSAAVCVTRDEGHGLEVFVVHRSPELRFFGGYTAMPGGVLDAEDKESEDETLELTLRSCALRELFEEIGYLHPSLARELTSSSRRELRNALLCGDRSGWDRLLARQEPEVRREAIDSLQEICWQTTPPFVPRRYRTLFLQLHLVSASEVDDIEIIPGELLGGAFYKPADLVDQWRKGERLIVPPVLWLLNLLIDSPHGEFLTRAETGARAMEQGKLHPVYFRPGVFFAPLLTNTLPPATTTNCFIVGEERCYVLDPASPKQSEQERLFAKIEEMQADGSSFAGILVSHHHDDHVGGVAATSRCFDLPVYGHPLTLARLPEACKEQRPLTQGDRLELGTSPDGGRPWLLSVYHMPGHDRGLLAFQEDRYDTLLVSDLVSTISSIIIDPPEGHMATYMDSLERLLGLPNGMLIPSHGPPARDGHGMVRQYLEHRRQREAALMTALRRGTSSPDELLESVYSDTPRELHVFAARSLAAGLVKLEEEGRARRKGSSWVTC